MQELIDKWDDLKKALSNKKAIVSAAIEQPKDESVAQPHPDHMKKVAYGAGPVSGGSSGKNIGFTRENGKNLVVRHGAAAHRTHVEQQMAKLLGADHMVPESTYDHGINHNDHHGKETFDPHTHGGTSFQEHHRGTDIHDALNDEDATEKLKDQWKNGDLHKLWALHLISNNGDMHGGNFKVTKDGVKSFDSDHAFYELPQAHMVQKHSNGNHELEYSPYSFTQLPSYLAPFTKNGEIEQDEGIEPAHEGEQVSVKALNDHAAKINPDLFKEFGPHAHERAIKVKQALSSSDPTSEMKKLWNDHSDKTGDLKWNKSNKRQVA